MLNWGFRVYQRFGQTHFFSFTFCFLLRILKAHFLRFFYPPLCISGIMKEGRKEGRRFYVLQKFNMIDSGLYNENVNDHGKGNDHIADDMFDGIIDILDFPMEDVDIDGEVEELQGESPPLDDLSALPCPFTGNSCNDPPTPTEPIIIDTCSGNISLHGDSSDDKESLQQNSTACGSRKFTSEPIAQTIEVSEGYPNSMKEKQKKKKKKKLSQISGAMGVKKQWCRQQPSTIGRCMHCNVTKTPQWREGPYGPKTLCNACGVCYKRGSLFPEYRPVSSPTFVASLHTNSRRKVIEMRHKSGQVAAVGASPTLVATSLPSNSNDKVRKTISNKDGKAVEMRNEGIIRVGAATSTFLANSDSKRDETVVTEADMEASMAFTTPISTSVTTSSSPHRKVIDRQGAATSTTPTFVASLHSNSHKKCSFQQPVAVRKCMHCETTETPLWRQGPGGPKSLCNACGIRYKSGRLLPEYHPAASPAFVASLHSNSHKKVVEMRKVQVQVQAAQQQLSSAAAATDTALPHLPQLLP